MGVGAAKGRHDVKAVEAVSNAVAGWARYQNLTGELDNVETSSVKGNYDWRSYLHEEAELASKREAPRARKVEKPSPPAPTVGYV